MKLYSLPGSIMSIPKQTVIEYMNENGLKEITVHKAKSFKDPDYMYCRLHGMGEKGYCGKGWCKDYQPRNGKSRCCRLQGKLYEEGKEITIKIK